MLSRTRRTLVGMGCSALVAACASHAGGGAAAGESLPAAGEEASYALDLESRTLVQRIEPDLAERPAPKFVQIEVADVSNPKRIPVEFEVHYQPDDGERILLGTFSLFPPDRPGTFLVATAGRLRGPGAIAVTLRPLHAVAPTDRVRVELRGISFRQE
jgi:hypothetical protein